MAGGAGNTRCREQGYAGAGEEAERLRPPRRAGCGAGRQPAAPGSAEERRKASGPRRWRREEARLRPGAAPVHGCAVGDWEKGRPPPGRVTETPAVPGTSPSRASPGPRTPLRRPGGCRPWRAPQQPRVGTRGLTWEMLQPAPLRCRPGAPTPARHRTPSTPLRWPARRCCDPRGAWPGSDGGSGSPGSVGVGLGVFMLPWSSGRGEGGSGVLSLHGARDGAATEQPDPHPGGGRPAPLSLLPPCPQLLGNVPSVLQSLRSPPFSPRAFPAQLAGVIATRSDAAGRGHAHGAGRGGSQPGGTQRREAPRSTAKGGGRRRPWAGGSAAGRGTELLNIYSCCKMAAEAEAGG